MKRLFVTALMLLGLSIGVQAQSVQRQGNTFTQVTNKKTASKEAKETPTDYKYVDSKGVVYQVFLSSTGKAFIWKTSKKTGNLYKQYLPEVGKQINPEAYKEKKQ